MALSPVYVQLPLFGEKHCRRCGRLLPLESFGAAGAPRHGRRARCKECLRELSRQWRERNPEHVRAYNAAYKAAHRAQISTQQKARRSADPQAARESDRVRRERSRQHRIAYNRAWRAANAERFREIVRRYAMRNWAEVKERNHRRRVRLQRALGDHRGADLKLLLEVQRSRCAYCASILTSPIHLDHMTPLVSGGRNSLENLCFTCGPCNNRKHVKDAGTFLALLIKESRQRSPSQS